MFAARLQPRLSVFVLSVALSVSAFAQPASAQQNTTRSLRPDVRRALSSRTTAPRTDAARKDAYKPYSGKRALPLRPRAQATAQSNARRPAPARIKARKTGATAAEATAAAAVLPRITAGTPLSRVLHTAQLSNVSAAGSDEALADQNNDLEADQRTTFDARGGSFDNAVGRSGARYEVYTAIDDRGTSNTSDDIPVGVLVSALDTNGDFIRDSSTAFDLERDFDLPSAVSVVSGTSRAGREFVVVSSSGYYNFDDPGDPDNEVSAGVVLLVRDPATGGFDVTRSRSLVSAGSNQLNNANALALLPNNDLLIADFTSNELRIVRDTDADGIPDTLAAAPYYSYQFSNDAPLDIAANSRGVVFSHSEGNDTVLLAIYDDNGDGRGDADEVVVEGLSLDNNLVLHGLTVDREGTVYLVEDASGAADSVAFGGNLGEPRIDAFPDPALNGILRDGSIYFFADDPATQSLTGLAFGVETALPVVGRLTLTNSASRVAPATREGLATINGTGLTLGRSGATESDAQTRGIAVTVEGRSVPVLSFGDSQVNIYVPLEIALGANSVVVYVNGNVTAADDVEIALANPGLFTLPQTGAGEALALLVSGNRYTRSPFPAKFDGQASVVALLGTGWRNSLPVTVTIGGRAATVQYAGRAGGFNGLDQINVAIPDGLSSGAAQVVVRTADGKASRSDVVLTIQ
jgi:uncharacterized protein (TIGR03437 family)